MQIRLASIMVHDQEAALEKALFDAGIPTTAFITNDINGEYARLKERGVRFRGEPMSMGPIKTVLFEDTCGNLLNLVQASG